MLFAALRQALADQATHWQEDVEKLSPQTEITGITCDTRSLRPGNLFVCLQGCRTDGHCHACEALQKGAVLVVVQRDTGLPNQFRVRNSRSAYALLCAAFYGNPAQSLRLVGVTGTNGKTTVTFLIKHILSEAGMRVGLIGTVQNEIDGQILPAHYTTPDAWELQGIFHQMRSVGCEAAVLEASSQALHQRRLEGCFFEAGIFTNLTPEHLDYHKDMESYYAAKRLLFENCGLAVLNLDDPYGRRLAGELTCPKLTFSLEQDAADFTAKDIRPMPDGNAFVLVGHGQIARVRLGLPGRFSVANAMAAAACCTALGLDLQQIAEALASCPGVPGRAEVLARGSNYTIIRDYAHTPDSLEKILTAAKQQAPGRVVALFGCGGDRDATKRPQMAQVAARLADFVVLTSDNPRSEDPAEIIRQAQAGLLPGTPCHTCVDRQEAIYWAIDHLQPGDTLLLCGKGHETYQVLRDETIPFDEREIVESYIQYHTPLQDSNY